MIITANTRIRLVHDDDCLSGIVKIAGKVLDDIHKCVGSDEEKDTADIVFGLTDSRVIRERTSALGLDISDIEGKREVYGFFPVGNELIIVGSDKRGAIYGLFHISDMIGISPLINWAGVPAPKKISVSFDEKDTYISKEPSVRYRGFFINDEWPAFGTWCSKHFGGINADMYEGVFELLLRMKGNYLWPAMWSGRFACDGPGLKSAELADEYGVVIGLSHHEPCLRHGEEYRYLRGKDSIYGDAWDFRSNREGITNFWRDGLKRNGHLENVITVGMRGERDSTILGKTATLKDNIDLLRDVLETQNRLIRENVNEDLTKVPRMLALYKEVEPYYYGDDETEGLCDSKELEDVILMLCDDNHGYLRTLPDEKMRTHKGGFGMYYHFDYHGDPVSYEWINSSYLPVVWEQMTACYEHGVRELWIVNVGDLGLNEMPLCYFLDLAYDYDKYGISAPDSTDEYMHRWMQQQFGGALTEEQCITLADAYTEFVRLMHNRRPEHMNEYIYSIRSYGEAQRILEQTEHMINVCTETEKLLPDEYTAAYTEQISYPMLAGANLVRMWIYTSFNHYYSRIGAVAANRYGALIKECLDRDAKLRDLLHTVGDGRFDGFGLAPHIGFHFWNSEESTNPVIHTVIPVDRDDMIVGPVYQHGSTSGHEWTGHTLDIDRFLHTDKGRCAGFAAALMGGTVTYTIECDKDWIRLDSTSGTLTADNDLIEHFFTIDEEKFERDSSDAAVITLTYKDGKVRINVDAKRMDETGICEESGVICMDASRYDRLVPSGDAHLRVMKALGRNSDALKLFPVLTAPMDAEHAPYAEYTVYAQEDGEFTLTFDMAPTNAYVNGKEIDFAYSVNGGEIRTLCSAGTGYKPGVTADWSMAVLFHIRRISDKVTLRKGKNVIRYICTQTEDILERICLVREDGDIPYEFAYFGSPETKGK